jgi:hypothetical protein
MVRFLWVSVTVVVLAFAALGCEPNEDSTTTALGGTAVSSGTPSSSSGQLPSTTVSSTPTTRSQGERTWAEVVDEFTDRLADADLEGLLPYSVLPEAEVAWLREPGSPLSVTDATGLRLDNGDLVVLFRGTMLTAPGEEAEQAQALDQMAQDRYAGSDRKVQACLFDLTFGFIVVSNSYGGELWSLAVFAHTSI